MMENKWKEVQLGDISDIISTKTPIENATLENYISTENMINDFGGVQNAEKLPTTNTVNAFVENDILFSNIRTYFKKVWHAKFDGTVSQDVLTFRAKENIISKFLYYILCNPEFTEYTVLTSKGAKMPRGDKDAIRNFEIQLPPLPEQKAIASVLSSLDDKIDLLHQQNQTLEALAETLFRQWFIVDAKEDWKEVSLGSIIDLVVDNRGKTPPTVDYKTAYPLIEVNAINTSDCLVNYNVIRKYVVEETYNSWFRKHLKVNDVIVSTVGTIGVFSIFTSNIGCIAQNLIGLRSDNISPYFIYLFLKINKEDILNLDIGGVQPSIKVPHLMDLKFKKPNIEVIHQFHELVKEYFNKIGANQQQIQTLTQLRDTLLPKLMSGEMRVKL
ncbi:restriction endonuclease subunit S [Cloacibacterium sp. TD35]|uniref:restriction endonuclease subunit S n=1 Tax=Cloacibacterium sp. TD35 TaxID=2976818 RepID=UPI00237EE778|nr:restriction endonuclease subunit S [Cloacibacterium sp. TD35]WDT68335.1 restriction endonuclease subunit S [Cloacibacterium sp. TD35]